MSLQCAVRINPSWKVSSRSSRQPILKFCQIVEICLRRARAWIPLVIYKWRLKEQIQLLLEWTFPRTTLIRSSSSVWMRLRIGVALAQIHCKTKAIRGMIYLKFQTAFNYPVETRFLQQEANFKRSHSSKLLRMHLSESSLGFLRMNATGQPCEKPEATWKIKSWLNSQSLLSMRTTCERLHWSLWAKLNELRH